MRIVQDDRLDEFKRLEQLLYGINYEVWLNLYGPLDSEIGLQEALKKAISGNCQITSIIPSSPEDAEKEIMSMVLYEGGQGSHPLKLDEKRSEICELMNKVFSLVDLKHADLVSAFVFEKGHPAYPVFWDFAFDIHSQGRRWVFVGSSSD